jgi:hypothetical protein
MNTFHQLDSQELEDLQKVGEEVEKRQTYHRGLRGRRTGDRRKTCSPREGRREARSPAMVAGDGGRRRGRRVEENARRRELGGWEKRNGEPLARLGLEAVFLKREMGTPDSLQCLSGAHRTAHSSCPVNHRTAHRKRGILRVAAGAPDIAQCSVRCTPDCPVSPDRGEFGKF